MCIGHRNETPLALMAAIALAGCAKDTSSTEASPAPRAHMEIRHAQPAAKGAPENFSGAVAVTPLFAPTDGLHASAGSVSFEAGARSAWHTHPAGQTLIVTAGKGWVQEWGKPKQEIRAGDVVWTPAGVKHWHGASATEPMTHIAIQEPVDGIAVAWLELVSDEQYREEETK